MMSTLVPSDSQDKGILQDYAVLWLDFVLEPLRLSRHEASLTWRAHCEVFATPAGAVRAMAAATAPAYSDKELSRAREPLPVKSGASTVSSGLDRAIERSIEVPSHYSRSCVSLYPSDCDLITMILLPHAGSDTNASDHESTRTCASFVSQKNVQ